MQNHLTLDKLSENLKVIHLIEMMEIKAEPKKAEKKLNKRKMRHKIDPVKMLQNIAKKFGFSNLSSRYAVGIIPP